VKGLPLSRAASGLVRSLLHRVDGDKHRILLIDTKSTEWQSLTFTGERHSLTIRIAGPDPAGLSTRLVHGLADAEFAIPGHIVADISAASVADDEDGSILVTIEALTICD
jgi:hypothetical protein